MMNQIKSIIDVITKLRYILSRSQKKFSILLIFLTFIGALFETLGVSVIIPLVSAMLSPQQLLRNKYVIEIMKWFGLSSINQLILLVGIFVIMVYIMKNVYLIGLSYFRVKYASKIQRELSIKMMNSYMKREYAYFLNVNTSEVLRGLNTDVEGVYQVLYQGFRLISEGMTVLCVCIFIMLTDFTLALSVIILIIFCLLMVMGIFKTKMKKYGLLYRDNISEVNKNSYQAFQGIKEITVMHRQNYFVSQYEHAYIGVQRAVIGQVVASESPTYIIEGLCVCGLIIAVCSKLIHSTDTASFVPQLAAFAVAAFRILPSLGRIASSFNQFVYFCPSLAEAYKNLQEVEIFEQNKRNETDHSIASKAEHLHLESRLMINDIYWRYADAKENVLNGLSLTICKGESVAFIGASGAGKTTLADVILGLLHPQKGQVLVDDIDIYNISEQWCQMIGYVPQAVYLIDDTIRKNVAFGIDEKDIDDALIWNALEQAQLSTFIQGMPDGLNTLVGERGIRFSGGQRQRIAIARALYFDPDILILDEATSALDAETEAAVMESIEYLQGQKTLIIIAHRLTTIKKCNKIYEVVNGKAYLREKSDILN